MLQVFSQGLQPFFRGSFFGKNGGNGTANQRKERQAIAQLLLFGLGGAVITSQNVFYQLIDLPVRFYFLVVEGVFNVFTELHVGFPLALPQIQAFTYAVIDAQTSADAVAQLQHWCFPSSDVFQDVMANWDETTFGFVAVLFQLGRSSKNERIVDALFFSVIVYPLDVDFQVFGRHQVFLLQNKNDFFAPVFVDELEKIPG